MTDRDSQLQQIIKQNPGIQFRQLMRFSGLKNGVLSYYLKKFEKNQIVTVVRKPRQTRFYSSEITYDESIAIKALRKQTPRDLLLTLLQEDGLEFSQLVSKVKKSPSTVSICLSQLINDGLVRMKFIQLKKIYYLKARNLVNKLIQDYKPSLVEKPTSGLKDIINSF